MPNWKKIIVSGSNAALNSLSITSTLKVTGSTFLSASSGIALQLYGSGSTIFSISGSSSEIFRISDDGSSSNLFSVSSGSTTILSINSNKVVSISGSLVVTGSITGSLFGTASWATNALTASYGNITGSLFGTASWARNALTASYLNPGTYTITSSWATNALTASYGNITGSLFGTSSWALNAVTASYITSSNVYGPNGANSILSASYATTASFITGSIFSSTNPALSASYALTASYALNGGGGPPVTPGGANTTIQFNSNGAFSGSANFTFNSASNAVKLTGSLEIADATNIFPVLSTSTWKLYDHFGTASLNWDVSTLYDQFSIASIEWNGRMLRDSLFTRSLDWDSRTLKNTNESDTVDWGINALYSNTAGPGNLSVHWDDRIAYGVNGSTGPDKSIDWKFRILYDTAGVAGSVANSQSIDWSNRTLKDTNEQTALTWGNINSSNSVRLYGTASFALTSSIATSASYAVTASYVSSIKSGAVSTWGGTGTAPKTGSVTFTTPYANDSYAVTVTGGTGIARSWTIDSKTSTGFIINSNAKDVITGDVYWIAVPYNS